MTEFWERLQYLADLKNYNQADLARAIKKDPSTVNKWWKGDASPDHKNQKIICNHFECDKSWLKAGEGDPYPQSKKGTPYELPIEETADPASETAEFEAKTVRHYRELAKMDIDTFGEMQTWINDMEKLRPGFTGWFRLEFQNRFPEFDEWKGKIIKNDSTGTDS